MMVVVTSGWLPSVGGFVACEAGPTHCFLEPVELLPARLSTSHLLMQYLFNGDMVNNTI